MINKFMGHIRDRVTITGVVPEFIYVSPNEFNILLQELNKNIHYETKVNTKADNINFYCEFGRINFKIISEDEYA